MKKHAVRIFILLAVMFLSGCAIVQDDTPQADLPADTIQTDPRCSSIKITQGDYDCNIQCLGRCINDGVGCVAGEPRTCRTEPIPLAGQPVSGAVNFSGIDLGPPETVIPRMVRIFLTAAMGLLATGAVIMGMYGMIVRTTAAESPEKIEESAKIFRNAIIGILIAVFGVLLVQIIAMLLGISESLTDFNLVPPQKVEWADTEISGCDIGARGYTINPNTGNTVYLNCNDDGAGQGFWQATSIR